MQLAIMRGVSEAIGSCELTHLQRTPIEFGIAAAQHTAARDLLGSLGWATLELPAEPAHPDCVFIEDTAVVFDELAIICRPGAASRRGEVDAVAAMLSHFRKLRFIEQPGTVDGGDVLRIGRDVYIGRTARTNAAGIAQFTTVLQPLGYAVHGVAVQGCLHLKTGVCAAGDDLVLLNPDWVDPSIFDSRQIIRVDPTEPFGANVLDVDDTVIVPEHHPRMMQMLSDRGVNVKPVAAEELAKAEGGLTCCCLLMRG